MKKIIFIMLAIAMSVSAFGQTAFTGFASNKTTQAAACQAAKMDAAQNAKIQNKEVTRYSNCDCSQDNNGNWACTVNAEAQKK